MSKYTRNDHVVEAFQVGEPWPQWMVDYSEKCPGNVAYRKIDDLSVMGTAGWLSAQRGDYIVKTPYGIVTAWKKADFEKMHQPFVMYQVAIDWAAPKPTTEGNMVSTAAMGKVVEGHTHKPALPCLIIGHVMDTYCIGIEPRPKWVDEAIGRILTPQYRGPTYELSFLCCTRNGTVRAEHGTYLIQDTDGNIYPQHMDETFHPKPKVEMKISAPVARAQIFEDIQAERRRQDVRWGGEKFDNLHTMHDWAAFITRQLGQAIVFPTNTNVFYTQMIKVAAVAVAALETLRRNNYHIARRHYDPKP